MIGNEKGIDPGENNIVNDGEELVGETRGEAFAFGGRGDVTVGVVVVGEVVVKVRGKDHHHEVVDDHGLGNENDGKGGSKGPHSSGWGKVMGIGVEPNRPHNETKEHKTGGEPKNDCKETALVVGVFNLI